ncbi:hypothetical protein DPMN_050199 [Dreissena polymorpha]|uniref:RING-type domain-containing protein n=1 Tax=Dreissena polymorpha TaxID=45954 RepID=A0A9D4CFN5_DREPO|nr:hypothetical protein DPMN_050199 [Dreissena polymorpha]
MATVLKYDGDNSSIRERAYTITKVRQYDDDSATIRWRQCDNIERENEGMMQKLVCTVGRDKVRCIVFLPCNHVLAFERCGYQANICMTCYTMVKEHLKIIRARLMNCFRISHALLDNTEADATRMGRYMFNLERPLTLHNYSSKIPSTYHDTRRCGRQIIDNIRLYFRIRNERNRNENVNAIPVRNIQQQNASLRTLVLCMLCISRERCVVFLPCGHLLLCEVCGQATSISILISTDVRHVYMRVHTRCLTSNGDRQFTCIDSLQMAD